MNEKDTVREVALKSSRAVIRLSTTAVRIIHRGDDPSEMLMEAKDEAMRLRSLLHEHPDLFHSGFVENALQELVEACIVHALNKGETIPSPEELGSTDAGYLLGLADSVGEMRRFALDALRDGDVEGATLQLNRMEYVFETLMRFNYPSALVSIRRKQDIVRSLLEKTRGEISLAHSNLTLSCEVQELRKKLEEN